ncbi:MAG: hypothetical protein J2P51_15475 [Hyphomicrobiaceae bacterium]|nr:hypothetical protein [Hyphomicrobiaceae bacterium]
MSASRTLATNPAFIVCDVPVSALDEPRRGVDARAACLQVAANRRVGEICDRQEPLLRQVSPVHRAACHREA